MGAEPPEIVVTGIGMRTAIGNHAVQSCASARAGINRFVEWPHFGTGGAEEGGGLVVSATTPDLGDGPWIEKAIPLVIQPLHEVLWHAGLYEGAGGGAGGKRIGAFLGTPYSDRVGVDEDGFREFSIEARQHCISPTHATHMEIVASDHAAGLMAMARAIEQLQDGTLDICFVGAVDSLLETQHLSALSDEGRLKVESRSSGLIPGEGAAFVALERHEDARSRGARPLARIASVGLDQESAPCTSDEPSRAEGLTRALRVAVEGAGGAEPLHTALVDLTGERWRFLEWALVETRCFHEFPRGWSLWHPADCWGDIGAAFGPSAVCFAVRAFERGFGGPGGVLICASSERGERATTVLFPVPAGGD